jgi:hypothetical protein
MRRVLDLSKVGKIVVHKGAKEVAGSYGKLMRGTCGNACVSICRNNWCRSDTYPSVTIWNTRAPLISEDKDISALSARKGTTSGKACIASLRARSLAS